jgi:hypothetical protein
MRRPRRPCGSSGQTFQEVNNRTVRARVEAEIMAVAGGRVCVRVGTLRRGSRASVCAARRDDPWIGLVTDEHCRAVGGNAKNATGVTRTDVSVPPPQLDPSLRHPPSGPSRSPSGLPSPEHAPRHRPSRQLEGPEPSSEAREGSCSCAGRTTELDHVGRRSLVRSRGSQGTVRGHR